MKKKVKSHYFLWTAFFLGLLSLGSAVGVKIFAETITTDSLTKTITSTPTETRIIEISREACDYNYSDWSRCTTEGYQIRFVESKSPDDCDSTLEPPVLKQRCTYVSPKCSYSYSDWSECTSSGYQTRTVKEKSPSNCDTTIEPPILKQTCNYTASPPLETSSTTSNSSTSDNSSLSSTTKSETFIPCSYIYSDWSTCNADGYQTRTIKEKTPLGCVVSANPLLKQSCAYSHIPLTTESQSVATTNTTPKFTFLNINGGEVVSDNINIQGSVEGAYGVEFYLIQKDSNTPKFIGKATYNRQKAWEYSFDSTKQPNGTFYIVPKIRNAYGTYHGDRRMIIILNRSSVVEKSLPISNSDNNDREQNRTMAKNVKSENRTNSEWQEKYFKSASCSDNNICGGDADPDMDGLNNNEEYRLGIDPKNPDSDQDGFLDGDEIKNGFNPLKASPGDKSDKIVFENPKEIGEIKKDLYKVEKVELVEGEEGKKKIKMAGKALPNSFVTLYIFSDPIILTVKTDSEGNWSYELDKDLEDGEHEVYVAVTDNVGKITAKSEPIAFVKTAEAVSVVEMDQTSAKALAKTAASSQTKKLFNQDIFYFVSVALAGLALSLAAIGLRMHQAHKESQ